ncbi:N-acetylglucosamine-6-phosphate deacetylase [Motilibacter sp. E257]|uniref:N-acetylglucosamine-6-phosphate deacetylase n=1 Tax=Motilibacter deserti TaxID=2714956 RepID=A0ABX0GS22_9ACTN|nr:N-acetylglucosamine-6-phosphate deacetylase [Motilibacter deserti]NHC13676.1 N-acetylglucosamine-6-phosphate deacetylase [Motilibacter deserti]
MSAGTVVLEREAVSPGWVAVAGERIVSAGRGDPPAGAASYVDLPGRTILPGFVDLHMHGGDGAQVTSPDPDEILRAVAFHRSRGTTRTLASLVTDDLDKMAAALEAIAGIVHAQDGLGAVVGAHLEGPFLNPRKRGSHDLSFVLPPTLPALRKLLDAADGTARVVTIAPELDGATDLIRELVRRDIEPAVGHTEADHAQTKQAFAEGARLMTHLFNAMPPLHHRQPGPAGAALADPNVVCELINDGVHVHPDLVRVATRTAGVDRIAFVTDATPAAGRSDGDYFLGPVPIQARGGTVTLADGGLAGSVLTMDRAVRLAVATGGLSLVEASRAASLTPARFLGIADQVGSIAPRKLADLVVLDAVGDVEAVLAAGTVVAGRLPT